MAVVPTASPIDLFEEGLPVRLIATPRKKFKTCRPDESVAAVVRRSIRNQFDFMPVIEAPGKNTRIVGLVEIVPYAQGRKPGGKIRDVMRRLAEEDFIGSDAGILSFIRHGDTLPFRFVVSGGGISGLVHLSDLQKLPVRAALFAMVTHLEMVMADRIRCEFGESDGWLGRLSSDRQDDVHKRCADAKTKEGLVEALLFTEFSDKITIIRKEPTFPWSKSAFEKKLHEIQDLRDKLAHANDYAVGRADAETVCRIVRSMDIWIERLAKRD